MQRQVIKHPAGRRELLLDQTAGGQRRGRARNILPALPRDFRQAPATGPAIAVRTGMQRQGQVGAKFGSVAIVEGSNFAQRDDGKGADNGRSSESGAGSGRRERCGRRGLASEHAAVTASASLRRRKERRGHALVPSG